MCRFDQKHLEEAGSLRGGEEEDDVALYKPLQPYTKSGREGEGCNGPTPTGILMVPGEAVSRLPIATSAAIQIKKAPHFRRCNLVSSRRLVKTHAKAVSGTTRTPELGLPEEGSRRGH